MGTLTHTVRYHVSYDVEVTVEADTEENAREALAWQLDADLTNSEKYRTHHADGSASYVTSEPTVVDSGVENDDDEPEWEGDEEGEDDCYDDDPSGGDTFAVGDERDR